MMLHLFFLSICVFASSVFAAFGFTKSGSNYVIDAGSSNTLVFTVTDSSCDITSIKYRGTELQDSSGRTQLSSGLGSATVKIESVTASMFRRERGFHLNRFLTFF